MKFNCWIIWCDGNLLFDQLLNIPNTIPIIELQKQNNISDLTQIMLKYRSICWWKLNPYFKTNCIFDLKNLVWINLTLLNPIWQCIKITWNDHHYFSRARKFDSVDWTKMAIKIYKEYYQCKNCSCRWEALTSIMNIRRYCHRCLQPEFPYKIVRK